MQYRRQGRPLKGNELKNFQHLNTLKHWILKLKILNTIMWWIKNLQHLRMISPAPRLKSIKHHHHHHHHHYPISPHPCPKSLIMIILLKRLELYEFHKNVGLSCQFNMARSTPEGVIYWDILNTTGVLFLRNSQEFSFSSNLCFSIFWSWLSLFEKLKLTSDFNHL